MTDRLRLVYRFMDNTPQLAIPLSSDSIGEFCRRWKITNLAVFGSILRPKEFIADSDVDLLATFEPAAGWSLFDHTAMEEELAVIVGRDVHLVTRLSVERSHNWIRRRNILESARSVYPRK